MLSHHVVVPISSFLNELKGNEARRRCWRHERSVVYGDEVRRGCGI